MLRAEIGINPSALKKVSIEGVGEFFAFLSKCSFCKLENLLPRGTQGDIAGSRV
jgi:hypothetical protein